MWPGWWPGGPPPRRPVASPSPSTTVTADLATEVAPLLREHGFTATSFLITGLCPSRPTADNGHLAWTDARALAGEGVLEFHSHTHSHVRWDMVAAQAPVVLGDVARARATLSAELHEPETTFSHLAWPWGRTCPAWEQGASRLGLTTQYVVQRGAVTRPGMSLHLPRLVADGMPLPVLSRWLTVLSNRVGSHAANQVFGAVRQRRRGGRIPLEQ